MHRFKATRIDVWIAKVKYNAYFLTLKLFSIIRCSMSIENSDRILVLENEFFNMGKCIFNINNNSLILEIEFLMLNIKFL